MTEKIVKLRVWRNAQKAEHKHRDYELIYVLDGKITLIVEQTVYKLEKNDIMLVNSNKVHEIRRVLGMESSSLVASVYISLDFLRSNYSNGTPSFWCSSSMDTENSNYDMLRDVLNQMIKDYAVNDGKKRFVEYSHDYYFLHMLMTYFVVEGKQEAVSREEQICDYIEQNYVNDISLTDLSEELELSTSYISRYFKKNLGMNFVSYLYKVRLSHAVEDLVSSEDAITDIAFANGFPNIAAFNKQFRLEYEMTPSEYRKQHLMDKSQEEKQIQIALELARSELNDYLGIAERLPERKVFAEALLIDADVNKYEKYAPIWNIALNLGPAEMLLDADMQKSILYAKKHLRFLHGRIWSLFSPNMYILGPDVKGENRFYRLDKVLYFLLENDIVPIIEFGEKQNRIQKSVSVYLKESDNTTMFQSYEEFLQVVDEMMSHLVYMFSQRRLSEWDFEIWDDRRIEVYQDKKDYMTVFKDLSRIIKKYIPDARVGGAGNYLGWFKEHTESSVRQWIDNGVNPDFLTYVYFPYAMGEIQRERMSKRKSDENDLRNSIDELHHFLLKYGFPRKSIYISEWNMTMSSRNYFNDSLWKAGYIVKSFIDNLGKVDALVYSQLQDSMTDYYDNQQLLNGSGGLLTRDMVEKPAFIAMRMLKHLKKYLVKVDENCIITRDDHGKVTMILHNFISRNYLYYLKDEHENTLEEHYKYFEHQESKKFQITLHNMMENTRFKMHHHLINRQHGSVMDEWASFSFAESLRVEDVEYLRRVSIPRMFVDYIESEGTDVSFEVNLEPLEVRCISITPIR